MAKITILSLLIIVDQREDAGPRQPRGPSGVRRTPTLDELFAHAFQDQHAAGPQSPPSPSDGRHFDANFFTNGAKQREADY